MKAFARTCTKMLGWRGLKDSDTIVFNGEFTDICAARGYWFAEYLGHNMFMYWTAILGAGESWASQQ